MKKMRFLFIAILATVPLLLQAEDSIFNELPVASVRNDADQLMMVQGDSTVRISTQLLLEDVNDDASDNTDTIELNSTHRRNTNDPHSTIPDQSGNSGKVLGTDGTDVSWVAQTGGGAGGDTTHTATDTIVEYTSNQGVLIENIMHKDGDLSLSPTKKFYLDGGGDSYQYEPSGNTFRFVCSSQATLDVKANGMIPYVNFYPGFNSTQFLGLPSYYWKGLYTDSIIFDADTYIRLDGSDLILDDANNSPVSLTTLVAGSDSSSTSYSADTINEFTTDHGVLIDGLAIKDANILIAEDDYISFNDNGDPNDGIIRNTNGTMFYTSGNNIHNFTGTVQINDANTTIYESSDSLMFDDAFNPPRSLSTLIAGSSSYTFEEGLTDAAGTVTLGGAVTGARTITGGDFNVLKLLGNDADEGGEPILEIDGNGSYGTGIHIDGDNGLSQGITTQWTNNNASMSGAFSANTQNAGTSGFAAYSYGLGTNGYYSASKATGKNIHAYRFLNGALKDSSVMVLWERYISASDADMYCPMWRIKDYRNLGTGTNNYSPFLEYITSTDEAAYNRRMLFYPNATAHADSVFYIFDTETTPVANQKILSIRNKGVEVFWVDAEGDVSSGGGASADTIPIDTIAHMLQDTLQFVFGAGSFNAGDTAVMNTGALLGSFRTIQDSIVLDSIYGRALGTGVNITVQVQSSTTLNSGSPTTHHTALNIANGTNAYGSSTFTTGVIAPGQWVWGEITAVGDRPSYLTLILFYHEKRAN